MLVSSVPLSETQVTGRPRALDQGVEFAHDAQAG